MTQKEMQESIINAMKFTSQVIESEGYSSLPKDLQDEIRELDNRLCNLQDDWEEWLQ